MDKLFDSVYSRGGGNKTKQQLTWAQKHWKQVWHPQVAMYSRVIHEKSNFKCLTSSSVILFIIVIKYIMQNFSNFEKSLEGATSVSNFVHKVNKKF